MTAQMHPAAPHNLPFFITTPGQTDVLLGVIAAVVIGSVLFVGVLFFWLHSLPERTAHKAKKVQFEIVAILGLISLFTHQHIFWVLALLLAYVELPSISHPLRSMASSLEKIAHGKDTLPTEERAPTENAATQSPAADRKQEPSHA